MDVHTVNVINTHTEFVYVPDFLKAFFPGPKNDQNLFT